MGDFNVDLLNYRNNTNVSEFVDLNFEYGNLPLITIPTRISLTSASCIDNIIINKIPNNAFSGVITDDTSDHFPVFYTIPTGHLAFKDNVDTHPNLLYRDYSEANIMKLNDILSTVRLDALLQENDSSLAAIELNRILLSAMESTCPQKTKKFNSKSTPNQPWFTAGLKISSKRKNKLFKKIAGNNRRLIFYRKYRNIYNRLVKQAKRNYYSKALSTSSHDIKKTWSILKEIISKKKSKRSVPMKLNLEQKDSFQAQLEDPTQISEYFNSYFSSIGERTANSIDTNHSKDPLEFLENTNFDDTFFLFPTNISEVITIALGIKSKSSTDYNNISNLLVKKIIYNIAEPLAHIFNLSFTSGVFPEPYKIAKILPIYKTGDIFSPVNYRPISLLPALSKILEKLVSSRLTCFIDKYNIIFTGQYGFLKGRSTEHAMLDIIYKITNAIEEKKLCLGLFLDLSKAFDTISHDILIKKKSPNTA